MLDTLWLLAASAKGHVLDWNVATWEQTGHTGQGLSPRSPPRPRNAASVKGGSQPNRARGLGSPQGHGLTSRRRVRVAKWPLPRPCSCTLAQSARRRLQAGHSCALPQYRLVGRWRSWRGLAARESQPERQVVLQTSIAQGHEGALTRLQVSATLEGPLCRGGQ